MRFFWAVAVVVLGLSVLGLAEKDDFKVKRSAPEKMKRSTPIAKAAGSTSASGSSSKDLRNLEHQTAKASAPSRSAAKRTPAALKPVKEKPNPPINLGGTGGSRGGAANKGSNPYRGRLKQKHTR